MISLNETIVNTVSTLIDIISVVVNYLSVSEILFLIVEYSAKMMIQGNLLAQ